MNKDIIIINDEKEGFIAIPIKEYKDLLIIKGKYEELKSQQNIPWSVNPNGTITIQEWNKDKELISPKVTW